MTQQTVISSRLILDGPTQRFLEMVDADPLAPVTVAMPAPGGYGKTTVLAELASSCAAAGIRVLGPADLPVEEGGACLGPGAADPAVLLVDDAHQLGATQLRDLAALAVGGAVRMVVAYRPWPRSAELATLVDLLGRVGPQLPLGPWHRDHVAGFLADQVPMPLSADVVDFVYAQTGGVPGFVTHVAAELVVGAGWAEQQEPQLPRSVLAALRPDLDRLDQEVETYLLAVEAGVGRHGELLAALLGRAADGVRDVMEAARATGLLGADGALLPIARRAVGVLVPAERRIGVRQRLAELQRDRGGPVLDLARSLLGTGVGGAGVAAVFETAATEAMAAQPALAAKMFTAALTAGTPVTTLAAGWARAAARSGDLDRALRLADQTISTEGAPHRAEAAEVAAAALAHRGQLGRSAELYRWAGQGFPASFATIGLIGTGQLAELDQLPAAPATGGPPTLLAGAATLMADGVRESVTGSTTTALSQLVRASALLEPAGQALLLPDSPAALAALVGLHGGELALAESVLERAAAASLGGPLLAARHRLLLGWIAMARGRLTVAREQLVAATRGVRVLEPRDWLFAVALEVGIARRNSDLATLRRTWSQACEAVMRHPVDLFTVLPLGEFAVAAARLRDQARLRPHLDEARRLLAALGDPPLWSTALHWSCLHAAIIAEQPAAARDHAAVLNANAGHCAYCAVLAEAATCWLAVVAGHIDAARVEPAARGLHDAGLCWDGARLAGQAAIRTSDRKAMVSLLNCARVLQGRPVKPAVAPPAGPPVAAAPPARPQARAGHAQPTGGDASGVLSDREREVAALVLAGLTYKQVGDRLFISAKTVEHHVARMRQKLGSTSRAELFDQLRQLVRTASPN
ncbi:MAG TPA: helix-turn-helix transcriptional regulator [Pseudonocardiaceae bacterium]|nr:helix-turn-helix transcriptional regulator [Pseudonocardiaceae bacterium]